MKFLLLLLLLLLSSPAYSQAVYRGRTYNAPVCSNPNCAMCNQIRAQLQAQQWQTQPNPILQQNTTTTTNQPQPLPSVTYELVSVPVVTRVKRCNGVTCWYENVTTYRTERRPVQRAAQAVKNVLDAVTPRTSMLHVTTLAPTPENAVAELLRIANPKSTEVLYDIGCGDGRILIAATTTYGCRSVGVELNPDSVKLAQQSVNVFGLQDQIWIYEGDALKYTYQDADVVTMYLYPELMARILPLLKPRTRVVSYLHSIPGAKKHTVGEHVFYEWITQ